MRALLPLLALGLLATAAPAAADPVCVGLQEDAVCDVLAVSVGGVAAVKKVCTDAVCAGAAVSVGGRAQTTVVCTESMVCESIAIGIGGDPSSSAIGCNDGALHCGAIPVHVPAPV